MAIRHWKIDVLFTAAVLSVLPTDRYFPLSVPEIGALLDLRGIPFVSDQLEDALRILVALGMAELVVVSEEFRYYSLF